MNPIADTAYYGCGARMLDAQQRRPVCNDIYAERFMDGRGQEIMARFGGERDPNRSNVMRHRYIDDELRRRLAADPTLRVVVVGCGFDSRAFRLRGGEWLELDEAPLIARKDAELPAQECPNPLVRIPIEFATEPLTTKLEAYHCSGDGRPTLVVLEAVTMYVPSVALERTLRELRKVFVEHEIIADLMTREFADKHARRVKEIAADLGVDFDPLGNPASPFERAGYRETRRESIVRAGLKYQHLGLLWPMFKLLYPELIHGYTVRTFV